MIAPRCWSQRGVLQTGNRAAPARMRPLPGAARYRDRNDREDTGAEQPGNGGSFELGGGASYSVTPGEGTGDGSRPASASWLFTAYPVWRLR